MPAGIGGMPLSVKRASERQSLGELALALHDVQLEAGLVVGVGREHLRRAPRESCVLRGRIFSTTPPIVSMPSESGSTSSSSTSSLVALRPRAGRPESPRRARRPDRDRCCAERLLAEQLGHVAAHAGHARRAADEDHAVELARRRAPRRAARAGTRLPVRSSQRLHERVELGARDRAHERALPSGRSISASTLSLLGERVLDGAGALRSALAHQARGAAPLASP